MEKIITENKLSIKMIGVGDAGIEVIKDFGKRHLPNVECLDMNTEWAVKTANKFVKIGVNFTKGLGAGALVEVGRQAAEEDRKAIIEAIKGCNLLIAVAGLGGGTGSGATPVVVETAKELKIPTIVFVTIPLELEGKFRNNNAQNGLEKLKSIADILFVLSNERFLSANLDWRGSFVEFYKGTDNILQSNILKVIDLFNSKAQENSIKDIFKYVEFDKSSYIDMFKN